jgi:hypothetical protein
MRKTGLALALIATAQVTLLSSPAFAADASASGSVSVSVGGSASTSSSGSASAAAAGTDDSKKDDSKIRTGWILVGVGSAVGIAGIIINIVGANSGHVPGEGGPGDTSSTDNTRTDLYFLGTTLLVAGVATGVYGGSLVWSGNNGTDSKASDKPDKNDDAKTDSVTQAAQARLRSAPSFVLPLVGATF